MEEHYGLRLREAARVAHGHVGRFSYPLRFYRFPMPKEGDYNPEEILIFLYLPDQQLDKVAKRIAVVLAQLSGPRPDLLLGGHEEEVLAEGVVLHSPLG